MCALKNNLDPKWSNFPSLLRKNGVSLVACDSEKQSHHFDLEAYPHTVNSFGKFLLPQNRTLIRVEPIVINPYQYQAEIEDMYGKIVVIAPSEIKSKKNVYWKSGYIDFDNIKRPKGVTRSSTGLINENKFSFVSGSNYKLRKKVIDEFMRKDQSIKLAGKNWDSSAVWHLRKQVAAFKVAAKFSSKLDLNQFQLPLKIKSSSLEYFGRVDSVIGFLSECKFSVVIENESTYVSEKLLNAIIAGCVPLYIGPTLSDYEIPAGVVVVMNKSPKQFYEISCNLSESECNSILTKGREWISSKEAINRWSVDKGFERLIEIMKICSR